MVYNITKLLFSSIPTRNPTFQENTSHGMKQTFWNPIVKIIP